jgi:tRNA threonylcarbamoyladenosine biosynthesis protein TsaB
LYKPVILLVDTSTALVLAILDSKGKCIGSCYWEDKPAGDLAEILEEHLKKHSVKLLDIKSILVAIGPGSFTGLRAGIAFVQGLSFPKRLAVHTFSSLIPASIALEMQGKKGGGVIPAKRGFYYLTSNVPESPAFGKEIMVSQLDLLKMAEFLPNLIVCGKIPEQSLLEKTYSSMVLLKEVYPFTGIFAYAKETEPVRDGIIRVNYIQRPAAEAKRLGLTD